MNSARIIIPDRLADKIKKASFASQFESGALLLCSRSTVKNNPWSNLPITHSIVREVIPLTENDIQTASPTHLTIRTDSFVSLLSRASKEGLEVGFSHGHPSGQASFSSQDDINESALWTAAKNRNGENSLLTSILTLPDGGFRGRIWNSCNSYEKAIVRVNGANCRLYGHPKLGKLAALALDRQTRVFGEHFNNILGSLNVTIVGAGGTGSPVAIMLARAGIKKIAIIDPDIVEKTNIHRLHGATMDDIGLQKADVIVREIDRLGLGISAIPITASVDDENYRDVLKSSDVIFCATDDHNGRIYLNRFAYFYETLVVDMGLAVALPEDHNGRDMTGRTTLLYPGAPCLLCRHIVDPVKAREEILQKNDPEQYSKLKHDGYVIGRGEPEPAFIATTTSVACMAIEEFVQAYSNFRQTEYPVTQRFRRFHLAEDRSVGGKRDGSCPICGNSKNWGRGDVQPFLDRVA